MLLPDNQVMIKVLFNIPSGAGFLSRAYLTPDLQEINLDPQTLVSLQILVVVESAPTATEQAIFLMKYIQAGVEE
jgi:hypothetical protein